MRYSTPCYPPWKGETASKPPDSPPTRGGLSFRVHPKIVQKRLGHVRIQITLNTYSHIAHGLQEAAANRFDEAVTTKYNEPVKEIVR